MNIVTLTMAFNTRDEDQCFALESIVAHYGEHCENLEMLYDQDAPVYIVGLYKEMLDHRFRSSLPECQSER